MKRHMKPQSVIPLSRVSGQIRGRILASFPQWDSTGNPISCLRAGCSQWAGLRWARVNMQDEEVRDASL